MRGPYLIVPGTAVWPDERNSRVEGSSGQPASVALGWVQLQRRSCHHVRAAVVLASEVATVCSRFFEGSKEDAKKAPALTCSGQFLCQLAPTLFRPFLAHFCSFFPRFFAVLSILPPRFRKPAPRPGKTVRNGRKMAGKKPQVDINIARSRYEIVMVAILPAAQGLVQTLEKAAR